MVGKSPVWGGGGQWVSHLGAGGGGVVAESLTGPPRPVTEACRSWLASSSDTSTSSSCSSIRKTSADSGFSRRLSFCEFLYTLAVARSPDVSICTFYTRVLRIFVGLTGLRTYEAILAD